MAKSQYDIVPIPHNLPVITGDTPITLSNGLVAYSPSGFVTSSQPAQPPQAPQDTSLPVNNLNDLISGIQANKNFGNPFLLKLEQTTPKDQLIAGLQQGKNFGLNSLNTVQNDNRDRNYFDNQFNQNYAQPAINATIQPYQNQFDNIINQANTQPQPTSLVDQFKQNPFKTTLNTVGNALNSPIGRGLLTAGIVGLSGGSPLEMLGYGTTAGSEYSNNQTADQQYRKSLNDLGVDTSGMPGMINKDTYTNYLTGVKTKAELQKSAYDNLLTQQNIYEKMLTNQNLPDKLKTDLQAKLAEIQKTQQDILKGNIDLKYADQMNKAKISNLNSMAEFNKTLRPQLAIAQIQGDNAKNSLIPLQASNMQLQGENLKGIIQQRNQKMNQAQNGKPLPANLQKDVANGLDTIQQLQNFKNTAWNSGALAKDNLGSQAWAGLRSINPSDVQMQNLKAAANQLITANRQGAIGGRLSNFDVTFLQSFLANPAKYSGKTILNNIDRMIQGTQSKIGTELNTYGSTYNTKPYVNQLYQTGNRYTSKSYNSNGRPQTAEQYLKSIGR